MRSLHALDMISSRFPDNDCIWIEVRRNPLGENGKMPGDATLTPQVRRMSKIIPNPPKIEIDFTDAQLTGQGGWALLSRVACRLGEYLCRFGSAEVAALQGVVRDLTRTLAGAVVAHEVERRGYVPVFVDGSAIKVGGDLFEDAGKGYDGTRQYWLHGVFLGPLWISGWLHPGGVGVPGLARAVGGRRGAACWTVPRRSVWVCADNAYYGRDFVGYCRERGWDYSVSVTHGVACTAGRFWTCWMVWTRAPGNTSDWASRRRGCGIVPAVGKHKTTSWCGGFTMDPSVVCCRRIRSS